MNLEVHGYVYHWKSHTCNPMVVLQVASFTEIFSPRFGIVFRKLLTTKVFKNSMLPSVHPLGRLRIYFQNYQYAFGSES